MSFLTDSGNVGVKLPNAMTKAELMAEGRSEEQAERYLHERVFGVGYPVDENGKPIERGKGSKLQPTPQHFEQLKLSEARKKMMDPTANQEFTARLIAEAVAKGIAAGMQAATAPKVEAVTEL